MAALPGCVGSEPYFAICIDLHCAFRRASLRSMSFRRFIMMHTICQVPSPCAWNASIFASGGTVKCHARQQSWAPDSQRCDRFNRFWYFVTRSLQKLVTSGAVRALHTVDTRTVPWQDNITERAAQSSTCTYADFKVDRAFCMGRSFLC